jgi:ligand-binding sensor domain-containing protein
MGRALIAFACCTCAFALNPELDVSQYAHKAWTTREGFFKGAIEAIAQTPDGYLWLGTEFGLLRFDGIKADSWQPPPDQPLPSNAIISLLAARYGTLWIGTFKGLASWKGGKLTQYAELSGRIIPTLLEDREGTIWAGGSGAAGRLCAIQKVHVQCYGEDGSFGVGVFSLYEHRGNLWAGAATGLWRWKPDPPKLYPMPGPSRSITALIEGDNGALWIASPGGGIRQLVDGKAEAYPLPAAGQFKPYKLLRDREGGLWIGMAGQGLLHVHQGRTDVFVQSDGLSGDAVESLFEDREGSIWVATSDGLDRFRDFAVPTISFKRGLSDAAAYSVLAAKDGSVWLGTPDGLNRWKDGQITIYRKRGRLRTGAAQQPSVREIYDDGLPDNAGGSLFEDDRGRIWVSTLPRDCLV